MLKAATRERWSLFLCITRTSSNPKQPDGITSVLAMIWNAAFDSTTILVILAPGQPSGSKVRGGLFILSRLKRAERP